LTNAFYEPLIERDLEAIPAAARAFDSPEELFLAVARFAVLAYSPSEHGKHALLACLSTWELREELGEQFEPMVIECARYAAEARQPWSEPPILEPPAPGAGTIEELREAVATGDRHLAERWLAARVDDPRDLFTVATDDFEDLGHKLIVANAAMKLVPILGEKGRFATLRVAVWELVAYRGSLPAARGEPDLDALLAHGGDVEAAHRVFLYDAARERGVLSRLPRFGAPASLPAVPPASSRRPLASYKLSRDYGALLKAHAVAKRLRHPKIDAFVDAVRQNLEMTDGFEEWQ
jgi:hypothetical protein